MPAIVRISHSTAGHAAEPIASDRLIAGRPAQIAANVYSDASNRFHCGVWEAGTGAWRVAYTEHEFCHMLAGRVRIVSDEGDEAIVATGDSFIVPAGFKGMWEVLEPARKLYAIYEPPT